LLDEQHRQQGDQRVPDVDLRLLVHGVHTPYRGVQNCPTLPRTTPPTLGSHHPAHCVGTPPRAGGENVFVSIPRLSERTRRGGAPGSMPGAGCGDEVVAGGTADLDCQCLTRVSVSGPAAAGTDGCG
jgi:hypothetical protein